MIPIKSRKWNDDKQLESNEYTKPRKSNRVENATDSSVKRNRKRIMKNELIHIQNEDFGLPNVDC